MASKEDCRKFWLCKEEEEGSRVLEVIWLVMNLRVIMRIEMMICKEEEEGTSLSTRGWDFALLFRTLTIATFSVLALPMSPWLPLQHGDRALCQGGGRLLSIGCRA